MNENEENLYKILNINESASKEEIKKSYRKLSLIYHPDKPNGDVEKFKKINNAYNILSEDESRKKYDFELKNPNLHNNLFNEDIINETFMNDFINNFVGGHVHQPFMHPFSNFFNSRGGSNIRIFHNGMPVNFQNGNFFEKPQVIVKNISIDIEQVLTGHITPVEIERWVLNNNKQVFEKEILYVNIPKGIDNGEFIILKDKGNFVNDTIKGDVKIIVNIVNNTNFTRDGLDLIYQKNITLKESLCGFSFELKHINKKVYTLNNEPGNIIFPGYKKVVSNLGINRENHQGSLIIIFNVEFPKNIELDKIDKLKDLL